MNIIYIGKKQLITLEHADNGSFRIGKENKSSFFEKEKTVINTLAFESNEYHLIPDIFIKNNSHSSISFNLDLENREKGIIDLPWIKGKLICQPAEDVFPDNYSFSKENCHCQINAMIRYLCDVKNKDTDGIFIYIRNNYIDIVVKKNEKFVLANRYPYINVDDIAYHCLNVIQYYKMDSTSIPAYLAGDVVEDSAAFSILYRYIGKLELWKPDFVVEGDELPPSVYFILLSAL